MPCSPSPRRRADWSAAVTALAERGLTVAQASRELGFRSRNAAAYHAPGLFQGALMTGAREWIEALPPREGVAEALALIEALTEPVAAEPLEPWPGVRLPNMRYARLLRYLDGRRRLDADTQPAHWQQLRGAIYADLLDWQAAGRHECWYVCRTLDRILSCEPHRIDARKADLVPLARPWGRVIWHDQRARLVLADGVAAPWGGLGGGLRCPAKIGFDGHSRTV